MSNAKRLLEVAFPLKQASIDSVHEKDGRLVYIADCLVQATYSLAIASEAVE